MAASASSNRLRHARVPVLGVAAPSGTGKTTLLRRVIALLDERGVRVGVIKQARADFDVDTPGKDSDRLRRAGVERLLLAAPAQSALIWEQPTAREPSLNETLALLDQTELDLILVEGFADQTPVKIEIQRAGGALRRYPADQGVIAVVTDQPTALPIPVLALDDPGAVAEFVLNYLRTADPPPEAEA